jgi:hypothetical protein
MGYPVRLVDDPTTFEIAEMQAVRIRYIAVDGSDRRFVFWMIPQDRFLAMTEVAPEDEPELDSLITEFVSPTSRSSSVDSVN